ncbi:12018_t:CDS:2, partial [Racocetra fulgida]
TLNAGDFFPEIEVNKDKCNKLECSQKSAETENLIKNIQYSLVVKMIEQVDVAIHEKKHKETVKLADLLNELENKGQELSSSSFALYLQVKELR